MMKWILAAEPRDSVTRSLMMSVVIQPNAVVVQLYFPTIREDSIFDIYKLIVSSKYAMSAFLPKLSLLGCV